MRYKIIFLICLTTFSAGALAATIKSSDYPSKAERTSNLKKYFNARSEVLDAHYHIYDANTNSCLVPGATDRDYRIILKINKKDILKWMDDESVTSFPLDYDWANKLLAEYNVNDFDLSGKNMMFTSQNKEMIIFTETGIVVIRIVQH